MSLLDTIISNHSASPVVTVNNDVSSINWVNGLTDPGEMLACGYLPEARRQNGENDETYAARIQVILEALPSGQRDKIVGALKKAALRRASLDTTGGKVRMFAAGQLPWHGLGTLVRQAVNSKEAIELAGLDWTVKKTSCYYEDATGTKRTATDVYGIVRSDTGEILGNVGKRYTAIQNAAGFQFLDGVLSEYGAKYETAGSLYNGAKVWMLAHLPQQGFTINGGDRQEAYVIFENCHDGSAAAACYPTAVRVVCANTLRMSGSDKSKGLSIRHTGNVKDKVSAAQAALGIAVTEFEDYKQAAEQLYRKPLEVKNYANDVLDAVLEITEAQASKGANVLAATLATTQASQDLIAKSLERKIERRHEILNDILERYESERCGIGSIRGTAWAAFNAVTEHADHARIGRQAQDERTRLSRRFESAIAGDADAMKQAAFHIAMSA